MEAPASVSLYTKACTGDHFPSFRAPARYLARELGTSSQRSQGLKLGHCSGVFISWIHSCSHSFGSRFFLFLFFSPFLPSLPLLSPPSSPFLGCYLCVEAPSSPLFVVVCVTSSQQREENVLLKQPSGRIRSSNPCVLFIFLCNSTLLTIHTPASHRTPVSTHHTSSTHHEYH